VNKFSKKEIEFSNRFYSYFSVNIARNIGYLRVFYDFDKILDYFLSILEFVWLVYIILRLKIFLSIISCNNINQRYHNIIRLIIVSISIEPIPNFNSLLIYN
jgi:hypothetical protein